MTRWQSVPFHTLFRRVPKRTGFPAEELLSVYREYGVIRKSDRDDNFNRPGNLNDYQLVKTGDLVLNKMKAWQGSLGISPHTGIVSPAYFVYTPVSDNDESFLHYALRCRDAVDYYAAHSTGIRVNQWDVSPEWLDAMPVPVPDLATQRRIVDYLDKEISEMNALIEEVQRLTKLVIARRDATAGSLLADLPVAPVSMFWRVIDCLHITAPFVEVGTNFLVSIEQLGHRNLDLTRANRTDDETFSILRVGDRKPAPGDVIMSRNASVGKCSIVRETDPPIALGQDVVIFKKNDKHDSRLLLHFLGSDVIKRTIEMSTVGSTLKRINVGTIKKLPYPVATLEKQREIADELDREFMRMDSLIEESTRLIENLKAHKTALITEVVTGRKEV
ncbi:hypothetical protein HMPREF0183_0330 [Brevibacterium mcbrellneri ATCC 49030]|uniref:Type I restriction modification DNA specificity domain-containing protein n=1 Tax=Brevibacterium mcbrellneri ATCC 49030 TaxID=585530 RepID=D4YK70_9MICO|nr:restriction endonuclease subunit S [Brevibacterium mcbrellneri]EFG48362.1 hypothetical protein HMPREF0183_0330 [Brevibacterium mcbrellneri ATCC 49030]